MYESAHLFAPEGKVEKIGRIHDDEEKDEREEEVERDDEAQVRKKKERNR